MKHFDHNAHHHRFLLDRVPAGARTALDVGCGNGVFARKLAARGLAVTAVDREVGAASPGVAFRCPRGERPGRAVSLASVPLNFAVRLVRDDPRDDAPVRDPSSSLREIRVEADSVLPGARFRRHLYWRYSMIWTAGVTN